MSPSVTFGFRAISCEGTLVGYNNLAAIRLHMEIILFPTDLVSMIVKGSSRCYTLLLVSTHKFPNGLSFGNHVSHVSMQWDMKGNQISGTDEYAVGYEGKANE